MDYSIPCPSCRKKHIYFSHEIGSTVKCERCGGEFALPENHWAVIRKIAWATLACLTTGFGYICIRASLRWLVRHR